MVLLYVLAPSVRRRWFLGPTGPTVTWTDRTDGYVEFGTEKIVNTVPAAPTVVPSRPIGVPVTVTVTNFPPLPPMGAPRRVHIHTSEPRDSWQDTPGSCGAWLPALTAGLCPLCVLSTIL